MTEHPRPLPAEPAEEFGERSYPVDEHMAGQRRAWRLERLGLAVLLGIVLVALSGLFASGPLSSRQLASQDGRLQVEYERFGRIGASHNLHVRLRGAPGSPAELRLGGDFGRTGCGGLPRLDLRRARVHVLRVLLDRRGLVADPDQRRQHGEHRADAAGNFLALRIHVLVVEDQENQRQEGNQRDDRAELVLEEEFRRVSLAGRILLVGGFPHQAAGDRENGDPDQQADQQPEMTVIERVPIEQDDPGNLAADRNDPGDRSEQT